MHPVTGLPEQVTVCRLAGGDLREYPGGTPPSDLDPAVGTDAVGVCWFWTSRDTDWELLSTFSDGSAVLGLYINGFLALDTGQIRRCTSEPIIQDPPPLFAWDIITQYVHNPPQPELNPPIGRGLTGLETFAGITIPDPWSDSLTIPGYSIDVEVSVTAVTVEWGDGDVDTFPPQAFPLLLGYPDGAARHLYEVKTCTPPGSEPDCDPKLDAYPITVSYVWDARWRANGGPWITVNVTPSSTTVDYPVAEAISTLTSTG
ncbi:MAG: hypothetical protein WB239_05740 [Acidimicrobiia bacterium]